METIILAELVDAVRGAYRCREISSCNSPRIEIMLRVADKAQCLLDGDMVRLCQMIQEDSDYWRELYMERLRDGVASPSAQPQQPPNSTPESRLCSTAAGTASIPERIILNPEDELETEEQPEEQQQGQQQPLQPRTPPFVEPPPRMPVTPPREGAVAPTLPRISSQVGFTISPGSLASPVSTAPSLQQQIRSLDEIFRSNDSRVCLNIHTTPNLGPILPSPLRTTDNLDFEV